jgi:LemA protein
MVWMLLLVILVGVLLVGLLVIFNRLVRLRNRAAASWSDIDVQLKRRHDLVGNLVEAVKGYAHHERQVLEKVTAARTNAEGARGEGRPAAAGAAETALSSEVGKLFALVEAYPDLKASEQFASLHRALVEVEDDLQNARRYYNAVVRDLNTRIESFPDLLIAGPLGFREREFFSLEDRREAAPPRVELGS